ncbi:hypothetical protein G6F40_014049 [Rhizopus arrhizus]|nr:hypothetical protein G6F40_014049 [Rhizopus arrhizus]
MEREALAQRDRVDQAVRGNLRHLVGQQRGQVPLGVEGVERFEEMLRQDAHQVGGAGHRVQRGRLTDGGDGYRASLDRRGTEGGGRQCGQANCAGREQAGQPTASPRGTEVHDSLSRGSKTGCRLVSDKRRDPRSFSPLGPGAVRQAGGVQKKVSATSVTRYCSSTSSTWRHLSNVRQGWEISKAIMSPTWMSSPSPICMKACWSIMAVSFHVWDATAGASWWRCATMNRVAATWA